MGLFSITLLTAAFAASRHSVSPSSSSSQQHSSSSSSSSNLYTTTCNTDSTLDHWLQETLQHYDLQIAHFPDTGRGIQTLCSRQAGEVLLSIPSSHVLFPQKFGWNEYAHIQRAVKKVEENDEMIHHALFNSQILTLALGILQIQQDDCGNDDRDDDPSSSCLLCTLPKQQYSISLMPNAIMDCLPPTLFRVFTRIQQLHNDVYQIIYKSLQDEQEDKDDDETPSSSQEEEEEQKLLLSSKLLQPPSKLDFLWAVASVQSRSFEAISSSSKSSSSSASWRIMLPGMDLINHKFGNEASLFYNADQKQYEFKSQVAFQARDEITYSYGQDADNLSLLVNFGFCIPNNPQRCLIFFDLDSILDAAQCLVPNIYLDPIIDMFKTQLKHENKLPENENLLFAYDGNQQAPHADLANAASTVQALGEQLAECSLAGLDGAMIRQMLVQRKVDLQDSLKRLDNNNNLVQVLRLLDHDEEKKNHDDDNNNMNWQPFVSSIRTLLQDEMQKLNHL